MIESEKDVFDAEAQIRRSDFPSTRRGLNDKLCFCRRKPLSLRGAAKTFDPHKHVRGRGRQAFDYDGLSGEAAGSPDRTAFAIGVAVEHGPRRHHVIRAFGQIDVDREPVIIAQRGNLKEQVVGVGRRLT